MSTWDNMPTGANRHNGVGVTGGVVLISLAADATEIHSAATRPAEGDKAGTSHFDKWLLFTHDCQTVHDVWLIT